MTRVPKGSLLPALAALAVLFIVLPRGGGDADVRMVAADAGWAFDPAQIEVSVGARVAFTNDGDVTHTATCVGCPWDTGDVQPGATAFLTFEEDARYQFFCRYHGASHGMTGVLVVGEPTAPPEGATPSPTPS